MDERLDSEDSIMPSEDGAHSNSIGLSLDQDEINVQSAVYKTGNKALSSNTDCCSVENQQNEVSRHTGNGNFGV